jgi:transcriptional regulator with XRE-family HTH domain
VEELGFALRLARERRGLTQKQVMTMTGINNKTLSGYENGVSEPDLATLGVLLKLYGVPAGRFLGTDMGKEGLSPQEEQLIKLFRTLEAGEQEEWLLLLRTLVRHREGRG